MESIRDIGAVDVELGVYRSPIKMAMKALEAVEGVEWSTPSVAERGFLKNAFVESLVLDKLGIGSEMEMKELRQLMESGVRAHVVNGDGETLKCFIYASSVIS